MSQILSFELPEGVSYEDFLKEKEQTEINGIPLYTCSPAKNKECRKNGCLWLGNGECFQTIKEECAAKDEDIEELANLLFENNMGKQVYVPLLVRKPIVIKKQDWRNN